MHSKFFSNVTNIVILQADAGWMMTVRLSGETPRLEVVLDGIHDETPVEEVLRRACVALGVQAGAKAVLRCESRLLKAEETLAEAGVSARDVLDICIGEDGGMPGVGEKMRRMLFTELAHDVSGIEGALQRLTTVQKGAATRRVAAEVPAYGGEYLELILPEFVPMNGICRSFPESILELLRGDGSTTPDNKMCTTLFCISSALKKLSQTTPLPETRSAAPRPAGLVQTTPADAPRKPPLPRARRSLSPKNRNNIIF
jgi:hypothetical protein